MESLLSYYPHVAVGTVDEISQVERTAIPFPDGYTLPSGETVIYSVTIERVLYSHGDRIGGKLLLSKGRTPSDMPIIGERYLFFLEDLTTFAGRPDYFTDAVYARFQVDESDRVVPTGWEDAPGVAAVSGISGEQLLGVPQGAGRDQALAAMATRTLDEAAAIVRDAATRASPVPTHPPRFPSTPTAIPVEATATPPPTAVPALTPAPFTPGAPTQATSP